jgi:hypothetical protein
MKKKLEKELNKLLPEGVKVAGKVRLISSLQGDRYDLRFEVEKELTKDQLLEKAKRDYTDGTIVIDAFDKEKETSTGKSHWYDNRIWDNNENCCLYDKGNWAKIIKKPIFKLQDKYMYEGDEFFQIRKHDNWKLTKQTASNKKYFHDEIERFSTKQEALNYVLEEAKERFKDAFITKDGRIAKGRIVGNECWNKIDGWIAEPIKEPKLMLGNYEVEIVKSYGNNYQTNTYDELTLIKCNGGQVTKEEWMEFHGDFMLAMEFTYNFSLYCGKYLSKYLSDENIRIGCIGLITIDQIQAITDRLNEV